VFSCLGQSVALDLSNRSPGYVAVDYVANHNLIAAATAARVRRFVYVSVLRAEAYPQVPYFRAHADVAAELRRSGLAYAVIQPTGFFSAYSAFLEMAPQGQQVMLQVAADEAADDTDALASAPEAETAPPMARSPGRPRRRVAEAAPVVEPLPDDDEPGQP
jgi:hypothetical protein